jgi:hypothetical protein
MTYDQVCNKSNRVGATSVAGFIGNAVPFINREMFEDTKGVIRSCKLKKGGQ